ncbi:hypothetical protein HA402_003151 [Bradysia odoriphaga]|nr:hypothetical protein HA402_003151 [Bradysia odoriphaga]
MNPAEKDFIQRGWDDMSNESIVKDVATKGKHINLAFSYLAKRLDTPTIREAKTFFQIEVNKYVERLLSNKLVFKAEHVLSNVNINPKFYFYQFYETCDNSDVRSAINNYLKKALGEAYEREHRQMIAELKALKVVKSDGVLSDKYANVAALEQFKELDAQTQKELLADVCFVHKCELVIDELDKHVTWNYLLDHQLFVLLLLWMESVGAVPENFVGSDITFEKMLKNKFSSWHIDIEMTNQIKQLESILPDYILNSLAKKSIFMSKEEGDIDSLVKRIVSSESLNEHDKILSSRPHSIEIIKSILDRNLSRFIIEEFVDVNDLVEVAPLYPHYRDEIELCINLKRTPASDIATISTEITKYLEKKDEHFQKDHSVINLVEILLQENSENWSTPSPNDLATFQF